MFRRSPPEFFGLPPRPLFCNQIARQCFGARLEDVVTVLAILLEQDGPQLQRSNERRNELQQMLSKQVDIRPELPVTIAAKACVLELFCL